MTLKRTFIVIAIIAAGGIAWYLGSPLFFNTTVNEELPYESPALQNEEDPLMKSSESSNESVKADAQPVIVASGSFRDADSFHRGAGTATIYAHPDGKRFLRFEDFIVTNGPALSVYLVKSESGDIATGYVNLGKLKGNVGNQNYEIPADIDLQEYRSVIIWCVPFSVTFSVAALQ